MKQLKNDCIQIAVATLGAELQSIRKGDQEYLWQGDPEFWNRRAPVLFPIVGAIWDGKYRTEGDTFELGKHGFARDTEFTLLRETDNELTFRLTDNTDSLRMYPYHFKLDISYTLDKNRVVVKWRVKNTDTREIHFQIGGHPAFNLPEYKENAPWKGKVKFDNRAAISSITVADQGCVLLDRMDWPTEDGIMTIEQKTFDPDAVIFDNSQVHKVTILDGKQEPYLSVSFDCPNVGLWSPYGKNAPFLCIEPWYGLHDHVRYQGKFKDKYSMNHLLPGATFEGGFSITVE